MAADVLQYGLALLLGILVVGILVVGILLGISLGLYARRFCDEAGNCYQPLFNENVSEAQ